MFGFISDLFNYKRDKALYDSLLKKKYDKSIELLNNGANPKNRFVVSIDSIYPIDIAIMYNQPVLLKKLLESGANPNKYWYVMSAPIYRVQQGSEMYNMLISYGAVLNGDDRYF